MVGKVFVNGWVIETRDEIAEDKWETRTFWQMYWPKFWSPKPKYYNRSVYFLINPLTKTIVCNPHVVDQVMKRMATQNISAFGLDRKV